MTGPTVEPSVIEQARAVLAKWGEGVTPGPWRLVQDEGHEPGIAETDLSGMLSYDPEIREAIDAMLKNAQWHIDEFGSVEHPWAFTIAAVIVAADRQMSA